MFKSTIFVSALLAAAPIVSAASPPPACLLACVNEHPKPADLSVLCAGQPSKEIQECLQATCPEWGIEEAPKYYQKICNDAGHQVKLASPSETTASSTTSTKPKETGTSSDDSDSSTEPTNSTSKETEPTGSADAEGATVDSEDSGAANVGLPGLAFAAFALGMTSFLSMI